MGLTSVAAPADQPQLPLRYNVAPSQRAPVVLVDRSTGARRLEFLQWGLIPSWAKDPSALSHPINARSETAAASPMFRAPLRSRRCVVPVSGFYEWQSRGPKQIKQPWYITPAIEEVFAFAGLWDEWRPIPAPASGGGVTGVEDAPLVRTFTILTTFASAAMQPIHHRMPVILRSKSLNEWLDPTLEDAAALAPLLKPSDEDTLRFHRVGTWVNAPAHDDARCIEEAPEQPVTPQSPVSRNRDRDRPEPPCLFG
jgi:putative SOS response-associated peptidase YedK